MPELPEVETSLAGIRPYVENATLTAAIVRNTAFRWPVDIAQLRALVGERVIHAERRAKYMLLHFEGGATLLLHLGMSGHLRVLHEPREPKKHDHIDLAFCSDKKGSPTHTIRFNDPRRFGCCLVLQPPINDHKLLAQLGPEPLSDAFDGTVLFNALRGSKRAIKNAIMDGSIVVGVGNIYASEALFLAGIRPTLRAHRVSKARCNQLAGAIKQVLEKAIEAGGTTLNDFTQSDGKPGYFRHELNVYGRANEPCYTCGAPIKSQIIGQRSSFFCIRCQSF